MSFALNLGLTAALSDGLGLPPALAFAVTLATVTTMQFLLLRHVVFPSRHRPWLKQLGEFLASIAAFRALEYAAFVLIYQTLGLHYLLTVALVLSASFVGKFLVYRFRVFASPKREVEPRMNADERGWEESA